MTKSATIPITNFYANGDYTAQLAVGSEGTLVNLILDTGSSTLAVKTSKYSPAKDNVLQPTSFAQDVSYGTGGWAGPLVQTKVSFGVAENSITLDQAYVAITDASLPDNFGNADGILGLAYKGLNQAYNLSAFFQLHDMPASSFPWPFTVANSSTGLSQLMSLFQTLQFEDIPPY
ncbi:MAG: pepsin-like aspartyl protease, partial [Pirellulaceae bacterium]